MTMLGKKAREPRSGVRKAHRDRTSALFAERRALRAAGERGEIERAHRRLEQLLEVSKLLTRFESIDRTVPQLLGIISSAVPLHIVVLVLGPTSAGGRRRAFAWRADGVDDDEVFTAKTHAADAYADLSRSRRSVPQQMHPDDRAPPSRFRPAPAMGAGFVVLPLVVARGPIFGALQVQGAAALDEADLGFLNAAANQLAVAIDHQAEIDARQAEAEERRAVAERARAESVANLEFTRAVTESVGEGVLAVDLQGKITFANRAARHLLGELGEPVGARAFDLLLIRHIDGKPIPDRAHPLHRAIETGLPIRSDDHLLSSPGGVAFPVSYTAAPLRQAGKVTGAVLVFEDIRELRRSEQHLRFLSEAASLFANSLDLPETLAAVVRATVPLLGDVCFIDQLGENGNTTRLVVFADPARQQFAAGVEAYAPSLDWETPQAVVLRTGRSLLLAEIVPESIARDAAHADLMRTHGIESMMVVPLQARGRTLGACTFVMAGSGRRYASDDLAFAEDVGRRAALAIDNARLYQDAQRATRSREDVLAVVSHDLRNLLGTIFTTTGVLLAKAGAEAPGASARRGLGTIERSAKRMKRLLDDLVDLASIEAGHLAVQRDWDTPGRMVEEAIDQHRTAALQKDLQLEGEVTDGAWEVHCDRERILQVLANLIGNAIKFVARGGTIRVRAVRQEQAAVFSVEDTGPGIPRDELEHVFDRYWQARKTARLGAGLGLAIAKGLVEAHGGTIRADSQVGVGTTFVFTVPHVRDIS